MTSAGSGPAGFVFVTGSADKHAEAERILGRAVEVHPLDLPEVQSLDLLEVLRAKGEEAWRRLGRPLVVEESGLGLAALNGFPGPLVKWMLAAAGAEGLAATALALGDPRATAHCALLYRHGPGDDDVLLAEAALPGRLVLPGRGGGGFGWDPVFEPEEQGQEAGQPPGRTPGRTSGRTPGRTLGEMSGPEKDEIAPRGKAWRELRDLLAAHRPDHGFA